MGLLDTLTNFVLSPFEAGLDSLGLSRHGRDMAHQESMAREQMSWQSSENQKNRDFSQSMYDQQLANYPELLRLQRDSDFNIWRNQFDAENNYNSPAAQLARLRGAGQNPIGSDGLSAGSSQMSPVSSVPPNISGSPLGGSASPVGLPQGMSGELMRDFGSLVKNLSDSRVNEKTMGKIDAEVEKLLSEKELNDSLKAYQEIVNGIKQVFGYKRESLELSKIIKESYKAESEGKYAEAASLQQKALARLNDSNAAINEAKVPFVAKLLQSEINRNQAQTREANAKAFEASEHGKIQVSIGAYYQAMADTENALRDGRVTAQELSNDLSTIQKYIQGNELKFSDATLEQRVATIAEGLKQQQLITQQQYEKLKQDIVATKWSDRMQFMQYCTGFIGAAAQILGASSGYYSGSLNRMSAKERNEIQSQFNDILDRHYTPVKPSEVRGFGYTPAWQE